MTHPTTMQALVQARHAELHHQAHSAGLARAARRTGHAGPEQTSRDRPRDLRDSR